MRSQVLYRAAQGGLQSLSVLIWLAATQIHVNMCFKKVFNNLLSVTLAKTHVDHAAIKIVLSYRVTYA